MSDLGFVCPVCNCRKFERSDILEFENELLIVCRCKKCGKEIVIPYLVTLVVR
jgi:hypothetical protein